MKGSEYDLKCDFVISAIGQDIELGSMTAEGQLKATRQNAIVASKESFETSIPGVFAGGDAITGPAVAIDAIAHGRMAAESIDDFLRTGKMEPRQKEFLSKKDSFGEIAESEFLPMAKIEKERMPELPVRERIQSLVEVETGFTEEQVFNETSRCLECGCSAYFDCALRKYATDFGVDLTKFLGDVRRLKIDKSHPLISLDPNKCISCGRCVRTCSEIVKVSALGFVYRGFKSVVKPSMEKRLLQTSCISCGNCIAACPTGAITEKLPFRKPGPWDSRNVESICSFCSLGCNMSYKVFYDHCFTVANVDETSHNKGYLCSKGRFGYRYMIDKDRLLTPIIKKKGGHRNATWDEAIDYAAQRLDAIIKAYGPESVAVFGSPRMTNEELYLLQKFVRAGLKTNNIGSFTNLLNGVEQDSLDDMFGVTVSTTTMDDLHKANVVLVINADISEENLIAELKVKSAQKRGSYLVTVNSSETALNKFADLWINSKRGTNTALLNMICKALIDRGLGDIDFIESRTEGFEELKMSVSNLDMGAVSETTGVEDEKIVQLCNLLASPDKNVIVMYNIDSLWEKSCDDLKAIGNLMMLTGRIGKPGNGIVILRDYANSQGLLDMGVDAKYLPGNIRFRDTARIKKLGTKWGVDLKSVFKPVDIKADMENDKIKALIIFGEDPLNEPSNLRFTGNADFLLVVDNFVTATAMEADVVLPASVPVETSGSYTACDRMVQTFAKVFEPKTGMENWQIICKLAGKLNIPLTFGSVNDIAEQIKEDNPAYRNIAPGTSWGKALFEKKFMTGNGKGKFSAAMIEALPVNLEKKPYLFTENYYNMKIKSKLAE
ncbi:MAG: molybdopterin-dependent oxidoreductase [Proteobacteria bacterium]|nr:molybdopterin-dependent oxidoreductase [Pseudomonadota bacterium]